MHIIITFVITYGNPTLKLWQPRIWSKGPQASINWKKSSVHISCILYFNLLFWITSKASGIIVSHTPPNLTLCRCGVLKYIIDKHFHINLLSPHHQAPFWWVGRGYYQFFFWNMLINYLNLQIDWSIPGDKVAVEVVPTPAKCSSWLYELFMNIHELFMKSS